MLHKLPKTPSPEERLAELRQVMKEERTAFKRMTIKGAGPDQDAIRASEWLAASSQLLSELVGAACHFQDGGFGASFPCEALNRVKILLEDLSVGQMSDPIDAAVSRPGRRERTRLERRDIAIAVFYVQAAKKGDIPDRAYIKTVAEAYDVDRTAVQTWVRDRDRICAKVTRPVVELLKKRMLQAAKRYRCNRIRSNWLLERRNIAIAVFYMDFAKKGDIPDRTYIQTVADTFEVDLTYVHEWIRNRDEICANVAHPGVALLKKRMLEAAKRYRSNRSRSKRRATKGSGTEKSLGVASADF
jgi:hypothetical protein